MKRGKILAAALGIAGLGMVALGAASTPALADRYCGPGYHFVGGYCYVNPPPPVYYYPPAYYAPPPVVVGPAFGINLGFGGGGWHGHR